MSQMTLFELPEFCRQMRKHYSQSDRITWRRRNLALCVGRVAGVFELGLTARRDGIGDKTKPHFLKYHEVKKASEGS